MAVEGLSDKMYAGNKRVFRFTITDEDAPGEPKPALDLTPFTVKWALSRSDIDGNFQTSPVVEKSEASGIVITDGPNGECEVTILNADTATLSGFFYFELELTDGGGEPVVVATGDLEILKNVVNS